MDKNIQFEHIPQEKFEFAHRDANLHDKKLQTKSRSYFQDCVIRFKKNKSSVIAAWIIGFLLLYAIVIPIISPYSVTADQDPIYKSYPPYVEAIADLGWGIMDGGYTLESQNDRQVRVLELSGQETGLNPIIKTISKTTVIERVRGKDVEVSYSKIEVNRYFLAGMKSKTVTLDEYKKIQEFQDETGLQVLYPIVLKEDIYTKAVLNSPDIKDMPPDYNIWYKCKDAKGTPRTQDVIDPTTGEVVIDETTGEPLQEIVPAYTTDQSKDAAIPYTSSRIEGDTGEYIYGQKKGANGDSVQIRYCYFNYYQFQQWEKTGNFSSPMFILGTNSMGQDLFTAIGVGARFSIIFAIIVSAINLILGAIYGSIQGYYGGWIDLVLDRISDILSGVPMIVVVTLFNLHLAAKVGSVGAFLLAFVATGWIGMAALTRKQFYRFKSQEHILAARTLGASDWRLMFKHIFPNSLGTIVTSCALVIPGVIGSETSLTYLGIIDLSSFAGTTIGTLMEQGQNDIQAAPHAMLFPSIFFALLMISFNLFGNGLRDAFNPSTKGSD
ncbi:MAG: ABC transporter permease [Clostridia bacterium]|nr:ABC transporter permease [Clostridia bacterium]